MILYTRRTEPSLFAPILYVIFFGFEDDFRRQVSDFFNLHAK